MLNVGHNQLTTLQGIGNCTNLKVLIANNNSLTELRVPAKLLELNTIVASHNLIETVENLQPFVSLKKLSLQNNKLRIAPDLRKNVMLSELRLNSNKISSLPPTLALNAQLSVLDLAHNHLSDVTVLWELPRLSSLHLAGWLGATVSPFLARTVRPPSSVMCARRQ
jgi:Leucine-rich repeat (LRR) protein